jgi:hypothetical protein
MSLRSYAALSRSIARLSERLAQLHFKSNLLHSVQVAWPSLVIFTLATAAHAQGTMDFSGATTLMQTFNVGQSSIEPKVVVADLFERVSK